MKLAGTELTGELNHDQQIVFSTVTTALFDADFSCYEFSEDDLIDNMLDIDGRSQFDQDAPSGCAITTYISTSMQSTGDNWSDYTPFTQAEFTCTRARFKTVFARPDTRKNIELLSINFTAKELI